MCTHTVPGTISYQDNMISNEILYYLIGYLIKELPVHKKRVVWLGQLTSQKGEEPAHLGRSKVWVVHHHLGNQKDKKRKRYRQYKNL